jgi:hypothetical protein
MSRARDTADQINRVNSSAADATAITVDSSENVLIGNTDATPYDRTSGNAIAMGDGLISSAQSGGNAAIFNRMTSDGSIVGFRKNGSEVGSIGVTQGIYPFMGHSGTGITFAHNVNAIMPYRPLNNDYGDGLIDIGRTNGRFKDAYLSGGIYLGGTGSANKLDDYEEGTFAPSFQNGSFTYSKQKGYYTKIGNVVTISLTVGWSSRSGSGGLTVQNLPFTPLSDSNQYRAGASLGTTSGLPKPDVYQVTAGIDGGIATIAIRHLRNNASWGGVDVLNISNGGEVQITASYHV